MTGNLRDRLKRIQGLRQGAGSLSNRKINKTPQAQITAVTLPGWVSAGYLTLRREITVEKGIVVPKAMPELAAMVMPGINGETAYTDLLFFDLETSGLSGGAGTVAFLAAFGRLTARKAGQKTAVYKLHITQYLLLDYPGESDFVAALLGEFNSADGAGVTMVSYNGKSFDSSILKTRCLMNGVAPPEYQHADLLHPSRRLWKQLLPDCSQGTIETAILGIDRTGDIPGALAPDIWFSFLRNGDTKPLLGICEHNRRDIAGLAAIFSVMARIADDIVGARKTISFDFEAIALRYGLMLRRMGNYDESREWLLMAGNSVKALRCLAIDSERRLKNTAQALSLTEQALELLPPDSSLRQEFERRAQRLSSRLPAREPLINLEKSSKRT